MEIKPIILAGGFGVRLWPLSRSEYPKQFLNLAGNKSLLQQAVERLSRANFSPPVITCNEVHESIVESQCRKILTSDSSIVSEPFPLGTAGTIALSAIREQKRYGRSVLLAVPVDSYFENTNSFRKAVDKATAVVQQGKIVLFGTSPLYPEPNYGYIRRGRYLRNDIYTVLSFHEKPPPELAEQFIQRGDYFWNSGAYLFRPQDYLNELNTYRPDIHDACFELFESENTTLLNVVRFTNKPLNFPIESADKAIMECSNSIVVKPCEGGWVDMGSWRSLLKLYSPNSDGNTIIGNVVAKKTRNSFLLSNDRLLSTVGIDNAIVVETADAVLVANKGCIDEIKTLPEQANIPKTDNKSLTDPAEQRPWGRAEFTVSGIGYLVKRLYVNSGHSLSLQTHQNRSEIWIVVKGTATVLRGNQEFSLSIGESVHIPVGMQHRLSNLNPNPLEVIEVQLGNILDENDIQRIDDLYNRV